jgi:hypothetical protein
MKSQKSRASRISARSVLLALVVIATSASIYLASAALPPAHAAADASARTPNTAADSLMVPDKGTFRILSAGKEVGKEEYEISPKSGNWVVRGSSDIQQEKGALEHITGSLELRPDGTPIHYEWSTQGDKNASSAVTFDGPTASIEQNVAGGYPSTQQFTFNSQPVVVLDNNLYDQYAVLARLYNWSKKGVQTFSVFVPQEITGGNVTVESIGKKEVSGKQLEELRVKTDDNEIDLFLDGPRLIRISAPAANAEILRE